LTYFTYMVRPYSTNWEPPSRVVVPLVFFFFMYVSKSMTLPTPHIGHSRHGLFFTRLDCQSNAKPSEKDHDLREIQTRDLWSSSQLSQQLNHTLKIIYR
jgi:hypothetical protein